MGNILGLQLAPILLTSWDNRWFLLMFTIGCTYIFISLAMWLFLVPEPQEVGIEMDHEETIWQNQQNERQAQSENYERLPD